MALGIAAGCASAGPEDSTAPASDAGRKLYSQNCSRCHGFNMLNPAPGIFDLRTFPADDMARFFDSVSKGKGAMPAWKDVLSQQEIEALWSYVSASHTP